MWHASEQQIGTRASLHTGLVREFGSSGSGFSGGDAKLQESIAGRVAPEKAAAYQRQIGTMKTAQPVSGARGHGAEKKDEVVDGVPGGCGGLNGVWIAVGAEMFERDDQLVLDDSRN